MAKMSVASSPPRLRSHDRRMRQLARCYLSCCTMPPLVLQSSTTHGIAQDDLPGIAPKVIADCTNSMEYSPYSLHRMFPLSLPSHNICKQIVFNINKHDFQHNGLLSHCLDRLSCHKYLTTDFPQNFVDPEFHFGLSYHLKFKVCVLIVHLISQYD